MLRHLVLTAFLGLAACSGTSTLLDLAPPQSDLRLRALVGSAMVRTVSLPSYAASEEIAIETAPGVIVASDDVLWADAPDRAITLAITGHLDQILGVTVGPDPWPFAGLPDVSIDIRVSQMLAGSDGQFRLAGQYFTGGDGRDFPNRSTSFAFTVPLQGDDVGAVAAAQGIAVLQLAEDIARKLGR